MKKVLLVCTVPALASYSINVIRAAINSKEVACYACVFLDGNDHSSYEARMSRYGLTPDQEDRIQFNLLASNKITRIRSGKRYLSAAKNFAELHQVEIIHFISQDVMLAGHLNMFKDYKLCYTVHDLAPHPVKLSWLQRLKHYYFRIRKDQMLVHRVQYLVTNSIHQEKELKKLYPNKVIYRHQMPSNVTPAIKNGIQTVPQRNGWSNYLLFFGRIELYKGLEDLYQDMTSDPRLAKLKLIVAGRGDLYFERSVANEENVLFINRYIRDEEIADLFTNAALLVLPYQSATQSAVTSIAYQYQVPVIASDIEGLRDTVTHGKTGLLYDPKVPGELANAIIKLTSDPELYQDIRQYLEKEQPFFNELELSRQISAIYQRLGS